MDLSGLTDAELLSRRHQAFLRLRGSHGFDARRDSAYEEIHQINRELRRRPPVGAAQEPSRES
jgi:hypothetical protein